MKRGKGSRNLSHWWVKLTKLIMLSLTYPLAILYLGIATSYLVGYSREASATGAERFLVLG